MAVVVSRDLQTRPQIAQQLCDLLGMTVPTFLVLTESYTLPHLIFGRKYDLISKIAAAHGPEMSPAALCMNRRNFAAAMAFLFPRCAADPEGTIVPLLRGLGDFQMPNFADMCRMDVIEIGSELLKAASDAGDGQKSKVRIKIFCLA